MDDSLIIRALDRLGKRPYRLEWFGQVYRGTATSVAVIFSPWGADPGTGELRPDSNERITALVPIPYLRLLRIGDVWENRRNTGQRDIQTRETFHLDIRNGSVRVMPAGVPLGGDSRNPAFPLPFSAFGGHREHTHAHCARIELDAGGTLMVPCMELVRFYFGASGSFLKRLFSGAFALDRLFTRARRSPTTQAVNIDLAEDLTGPAAATVARIAFDRQARSAAAWIVNSAVAATANNFRYYPKTTFPFHGETNLTVDGRWIAQDGHRVFLAERLIRCTHPFPFDTLFYTTCKSLANRRKLFAPPRQEPSDPDEPEDSPPSPEIQLQEVVVSSLLQPVGIPVGEEADEPFPDLARKKIRRVKQTAPHAPLAPREEEPAELGTGPDASAGEVREAEVTAVAEDSAFDEEALEELPTEALEMFNEAFGAFRAASGDRYMLGPPLPDIEPDPLRPGPFRRADAVCRTRDERLEHVWCAMVIVNDGSFAHVLVLTRGHVSRDYDDHLMLVHIDDSGDVRLEVERCCIEFAQGRLSAGFGRNVLVRKSTASATNLYSLLRDLSVGFWQVHSGRAEDAGPAADAMATLGKPLPSMRRPSSA